MAAEPPRPPTHPILQALHWLRERVWTLIGGAIATVGALFGPVGQWPYWSAVLSLGLFVLFLASLPATINAIRGTPAGPSGAATPSAVPVESAKLTASFTEMVQLIPIAKNETFHGTVAASNRATTIVFAQIVVRNNGAPSIADGWSMWLTVNGRDIEAEAVPIPDFTFRLREGVPALQYTQQEAVYNVTVSKPITQGIPVRGFFFGHFPLAKNTVIKNLATLRMKFVDSQGKHYESIRKERGKLRPDAEVIPGLGKIVP